MNARVEPDSGADVTNERHGRPGWMGTIKKVACWSLAALGLLALTLSIVGWINRDRIEIPPGRVGQYLDVQGERIRYYQTGHGPDVLVIHGLPGALEDFKPLMDAARQRYRITAYDRPGHGFSGAQRTDYTLGHNADVALSIIDQLQLKDVIVVGHSYGGAVVLAMAVRNPPQVKAFLALAGVTSPHPAGLNVFDVLRLPLVGRGVAAITSHVFGQGMVREGMRLSFTPNEELLTEELLSQGLAVFLQPKVIMALAGESGALNRDLAAIEPGLPAIAQRLHLIHGQDDHLIPVADAVHFHERFPASKLTLLKDTGHFVPFVRPEVVLSVMDSLNK